MIAGGFSIPANADGADPPFGAVLFLLTVPTRKFSRGQTVKQGKHNAIMLLAQSKLDRTANVISQAMQDKGISPNEFHKVLQER